MGAPADKQRSGFPRFRYRSIPPLTSFTLERLRRRYNPLRMVL
jgi:hypothetical protein